MAKSRSEKDKRYEERHKEERKAKNVIWGTSVPRAFAEEIDAFLKKHRYTKVKLIEEGYKALLEQADEIDTDLAKIMDGYDDFFESELKQFEEEKKNSQTKPSKPNNQRLSTGYVPSLRESERRILRQMERVYSIHRERAHRIRAIKMMFVEADTRQYR